MSEDWFTEPGQTPLDSTEGLRISVRSREELDQAEFRNIAKATVHYLNGRPTKRSAPFTLKWATRVHERMFGDVWDWAGSTRQSDLNFGSPWHQVQPELYDLLEKDLPYWQANGTSQIETAARLHYRAVKIHPFKNGNGRWSRMLTDIWLKRETGKLILWPPTMGRESPERARYIRCLKQMDNKGDLEPFVEFHREYFGDGP